MMKKPQLVFLCFTAIGIGIAFLLFDQLRTIQSLRLELAQRPALARQEPEALPATEARTEQTYQIAPPAIAAEPPPASPLPVEPPPSIRPEQSATNAPQTNVHELLARLRDTEIKLEQTARMIPEPADVDGAYVGHGTWLSSEPAPRVGITKIIISGQARNRGTVSTMSIKAWGKCTPADCEWQEVPFHLLDSQEAPRAYRRGFAVWDYEDGRRTHLLITFDKLGLHVHTIGFRGDQRTPYSKVERMLRVN